MPAPGMFFAEKSGDGYLVSGKAAHVMDGAHASHMLLMAKDAGNPSILALVESSTPGLILAREGSLDHMRPCYGVECSKVEVPVDSVLARGEAAESAFESATALTGLAAAAEMIGAMHWILQATLISAKKRKKTGQTVAQFQHIPGQCTNFLSEVDTCRQAVFSAAKALEQSGNKGMAAVQKARNLVSETSDALGSLLIHCQEGMDLTWEHDIHMFRSVPPFFGSIS
jgi:alkylation response protein AidB-like acyl-CoA dehydrogenase